MFVSHLHGDHFGGLPFLILDAQFAGRTAPLVVAGPPGTGQRLTEAMECLFPGSSRVRRRFAVEVTELRPCKAPRPWPACGRRPSRPATPAAPRP